MNSEKYKVQKVIHKLIKATAEGEISWSISHNSSVKLEEDGELIGKAYTTNYMGRIFRMYAFKYLMYQPDFDKFYKTTSKNLELIDFQNEVLWIFPYDNSINDLYDMVRYKVANVDQLLDDLLGEAEVNVS